MKSLLPALTLALALTACTHSNPPQQTQQQQPPTQPPPQTPAPATAPAPAAATTTPTKTEMRNVLFHLTPNASAHLITLSGEVVPTGKNEFPVFDDKTSFEFHVTNGTVSITMDALADIMNSYVFAKPGAPLKNLKVTIKDGLLDIKGNLHSKGDVPFETTGSLSVDPDGRIRVHTEKVKAMKIPLKKVMSVFGIDLASVVNTDKIDG